MPSNSWRDAPLAEVAEFRNGKAHGYETAPAIGPVPIFGSNGVIGRADTALYETPVTVVGRVGAYCGSLHYSGSPSWVTDNAIAAIAKNGIDQRYLHYLLTALDLPRVAIGSAQPLLTQSALNLITARIAPCQEQRSIASILGALDDKIELNRKMSATLEAIARALFKSWFIDFDPVKAKADGWDSGLASDVKSLFPDSFEMTSAGETPKGWRVGVLSDIVDIGSGKRPPQRQLTQSAECVVPVWGGNGPMAYTAEPLISEPILLTGRVGTLGSVFRISNPIWPSDNTLIVKAKDGIFYEYAYFQLRLIDFRSLNRGSTQPLVTQGDLSKQGIVIPDARIMQSFSNVARSLFARLDVATQESTILTALRDALLPKLISGELRVGDAERILEKSA